MGLGVRGTVLPPPFSRPVPVVGGKERTCAEGVCYMSAIYQASTLTSLLFSIYMKPQEELSIKMECGHISC